MPEDKNHDGPHQWISNGFGLSFCGIMFCHATREEDEE